MDPAAEATVWQMFASACVNGTLGLSALKRPMLTAAARMLRRTRGGEEEEGARKGREGGVGGGEGASDGGGNDGRRDEIRRRVATIDAFSSAARDRSVATRLPPCAHPALRPNETFIALTTKPTTNPARTARRDSGSTSPSCAGFMAPRGARVAEWR